MEIDKNSKKEEELLGKHLASIINDLFYEGTKVSVKWEMSDIEDKATGIYVSAIINRATLTDEQRAELESNGLRFVERGTHVIDNRTEKRPGKMELFFELKEEFVNKAL